MQYHVIRVSIQLLTDCDRFPSEERIPRVVRVVDDVKILLEDGENAVRSHSMEHIPGNSNTLRV